MDSLPPLRHAEKNIIQRVKKLRNNYEISELVDICDDVQANVFHGQPIQNLSRTANQRIKFEIAGVVTAKIRDIEQNSVCKTYTDVVDAVFDSKRVQKIVKKMDEIQSEELMILEKAEARMSLGKEGMENEALAEKEIPLETTLRRSAMRDGDAPEGSLILDRSFPPVAITEKLIQPSFPPVEPPLPQLSEQPLPLPGFLQEATEIPPLSIPPLSSNLTIEMAQKEIAPTDSATVTREGDIVPNVNITPQEIPFIPEVSTIETQRNLITPQELAAENIVRPQSVLEERRLGLAREIRHTVVTPEIPLGQDIEEPHLGLNLLPVVDVPHPHRRQRRRIKIDKTIMINTNYGQRADEMNVNIEFPTEKNLITAPHLQKAFNRNFLMTVPSTLSAEKNASWAQRLMHRFQRRLKTDKRAPELTITLPQPQVVTTSTRKRSKVNQKSTVNEQPQDLPSQLIMQLAQSPHEPQSEANVQVTHGILPEQLRQTTVVSESINQRPEATSREISPTVRAVAEELLNFSQDFQVPFDPSILPQEDTQQREQDINLTENPCPLLQVHETVPEPSISTQNVSNATELMADLNALITLSELPLLEPQMAVQQQVETLPQPSPTEEGIQQPQTTSQVAESMLPEPDEVLNDLRRLFGDFILPQTDIGETAADQRVEPLPAEPQSSHGMHEQQESEDVFRPEAGPIPRLNLFYPSFVYHLVQTAWLENGGEPVEANKLLEDSYQVIDYLQLVSVLLKLYQRGKIALKVSGNRELLVEQLSPENKLFLTQMGYISGL